MFSNNSPKNEFTILFLERMVHCPFLGLKETRLSRSSNSSSTTMEAALTQQVPTGPFRVHFNRGSHGSGKPTTCHQWTNEIIPAQMIGVAGVRYLNIGLVGVHLRQLFALGNNGKETQPPLGND